MKLAEEMGVSRTPVREAIRQLELEGGVQHPNKGVFVEGITRQDIQDIYAIRECMEGLAARWAIERIDKKLLRNWKYIRPHGVYTKGTWTRWEN